MAPTIPLPSPRARKSRGDADIGAYSLLAAEALARNLVGREGWDAGALGSRGFDQRAMGMAPRGLQPLLEAAENAKEICLDTKRRAIGDLTPDDTQKLLLGWAFALAGITRRAGGIRTTYFRIAVDAGVATVSSDRTPCVEGQLMSGDYALLI